MQMSEMQVCTHNLFFLSTEGDKTKKKPLERTL